MPAATLQFAFPLFAEFKVETLIPALGVMLIVSSLMIGLRKRRKMQATNPRLTPQEQFERNKQLRGMQGDLEQLMVEIEQFAKRLGAQLDAKTIHLETLLKQAERRVQELKSLTGGRDDSRPPTFKVEQERSAPVSTTAAPMRAEATATVPTESEASDPIAKAVYRLADQGMEPLDIAQKLGEHVGKVELILALRN